MAERSSSSGPHRAGAFDIRVFIGSLLGIYGVVAHLVRDRLNTYMKEKFPEIADTYEIDRCRMPWRRMFEVDLTLKRRTE